MSDIIFIHNLNPIAINIIGVNIYWYSLAYILGFVFSLFYTKNLIKKGIINLNINIMDDFISWAIIGVIIGGRLGYVLFYNLEFYSSNLLDIIKIWKGGMSFHGGLVGLLLSVFLFSKKKNIYTAELVNLVALCSPIGIFLGRVANFINGELVGKPTNQNWGVLFESGDLLRHPSQLYEAFCEGLMIFIIFQIFIKFKLSNKVNFYSIFLINYSIVRFSIEFFREPDQQLGLIFLNLSMGQILCIPMFLAGIIFIKYGKN